MEPELKTMLDKIQKGYTDYKGANEKLTARVLDMERKVADRTPAPAPGAGAPVGPNGEGGCGMKLSRFVRGVKFGKWDGAEKEKEWYHDSRDLTSDDDGAGGFIVPPELVAELIPLLRSKTVLDKLPVLQMFDLKGSPVPIPKQKSAATGFWTGEGQLITKSEQGFGQVNGTPKEAAGLTKLSNRLLRLSSPGVEAIVRDDLMKVIARLIDLAMLRGTGGENEPLGIVNTPGISIESFGTPNGGAVTYEKLIDMIGRLDDADVDDTGRMWVFHPKIRRKLAKLLDLNGRPIFAELQSFGGQTLAPMRDLLGHEWITTTQIPTDLVEGSATTLSEIYFAEWPQLAWMQWGQMEIKISDEAGEALERNQTFIRIIMEVDFVLRQEEAFVVANDVITL